ncbi:Uncharacterised protein [Halioglobus japonicus]|nr:Uncharacterised protein [Halioglobus japonicus]
MEKKLFYLGVGCQKGGTTWLHSQLNASQFVRKGFSKEYHVFDALYVEECSAFLTNKIDKLKQQIQSGVLMEKQDNLLKLLEFCRNPQSYFDYFDHLWSKSDKTIAVGDITPTYCALPVAGFRAIKQGLENRGFTVKIIFIMRDPIERCWSMLRMHREDVEHKNPAKTLAKEQTELASYYNSRQCELRTRYEQTVKNLEAVFDSDNIYYGIYETLFEKETLQQLQDFLELPDFNPDINKKVNVTKKHVDTLSVELMSDIARFYRETYQFCEDRFGTAKQWSGYQYL